LPDAPAQSYDLPGPRGERSEEEISRHGSSTSLPAVWEVLVRRRVVVLGVVGGMLLACLLYCLIAPNQYEASARVELRTSPASSLNLDTAESLVSSSILSAPMQLETQANVFRSDQLAWHVIRELRMYQAAGFMGSFAWRFPQFRPDAPLNDGANAAAQAWLLERFQRRLHVQSLPRTLLIQIRFRSRDAALSAAVVNELIHAYEDQETELHLLATGQASSWLEGQLKELKTRGEQDQQRLAKFQREHGILSTAETLANGQPGDTQHTTALLEVDELGRQLVAATTDRLQREAEYRSASHGDPELAVASDPRLQQEGGGFATALLQQIHARHSELELEAAQLGSEHGPNFPRVVEIRSELADLNRQKEAEDAKLVDRFKSAWQTAVDRERLVRKSLEEYTAEGMKLDEASMEYEVMRREADASHAVYMRVLEKVEEAGLAAGVHGSSISVVDPARQPVKPVSPDLPLYLAITFFVSVWVAVGVAFMMDSPERSRQSAAVLLLVILACARINGQAPTPNTSGLPSGVVKIPPPEEIRVVPNPKDAPPVWNQASQAGSAPATSQSASPMAAPIGPGDFLDVSEFHTPEFHSAVRVSVAGTIALPLINEAQVGGMDERSAAHAIEAALIAKGMLLHPQVSVLVTAYAGQDVSVLGEVTKPGVYPYTLHHRLLDLISAASGVAPTAGTLVNIFHRSEPNTPHIVVLDPSGMDTSADHNPELAPGDTVQVSRAGLVFVVGDVIRPGGFPVDPAQGLTVVQALTLAWGPTQNAAANKALLIREQKGGRTLTTLNLRRMLRGQDPDQPIHDHDILYVPDSMAKNLMNRTMESAIQSAIGVTIYAGLVYSQRF
jgi:polysaccharide biosynthesis/export protein